MAGKLKFTDYTDAEIAEFIAEKMGFQKKSIQIDEETWIKVWLDAEGKEVFEVHDAPCPFLEQCRKGEIFGHRKRIFNPMHSLDRCWDFEEWLKNKDNKEFWFLYKQNVKSIMFKKKDLDDALHASKEVRCHAFLKTFGGCDE